MQKIIIFSILLIRNLQSYSINQAADYVANALYGWYEYHDDIYYNPYKNKIYKTLKFPYGNFGK